ncbi:MAG: hypothetical protein K2Q06_09795 [Parvularculaceae bacterium]|nr:hypothetical protein [Parvularculaceae bacterium]
MARLHICFFGITRSLRYTLPSIRKHVFAPAAAFDQVVRFGHFFSEPATAQAADPRDAPFDPGEGRDLGCDRLALEPANACLDLWHFDQLAAFGDAFNNDFRSLRNLVHQLHSLKQVTDAALADGAERVLFCRPDLRYHDSLAPLYASALAASDPKVFLPSWQPWGGCNDRFALAVGPAAIAAYGRRIERALDYCRARGPLHAEQLLKFALDEAGVPVSPIAMRASRIRATGAAVAEDFGDHESAVRNARRVEAFWAMFDRSGLKPLAKAVYRPLHAMRRTLIDLGRKR